MIREETLMIDEVLTATEDCRSRRSGEYELCELASVDESAIGDKTISDSAVFEDTVSHQSSDEELYYVDRILAEMHEGGSTYYPAVSTPSLKRGGDSSTRQRAQRDANNTRVFRG